MSITLNLNPDVEARAESQAAARGLSVEEYLEEAVEQLVSAPATGAELLEHWRREGVVGAWADREDIQDSAAYARQLRNEAETRRRG
jgi:hypothetical protein